MHGWPDTHDLWRHQVKALNDAGFFYTTTLSAFHVLPKRLRVRAPTLVYSARNAWRRGASLAWNAALARASAAAELVRFGFHPADVRHPNVMSHALCLLERLAGERRPLTKAGFAHTVG